MKKTLIQLGKSIIVILYWALVAFFVWLFYDEYIIEQQWPSICMCIAFSSFGCATYVYFMNLLYKAEFKSFERKHPKGYEILAKIATIASGIFAAIFVISFIIGIVGDFFLICIYGLYLILSIFWKYWIVIIVLFTTCIFLTTFKQPIIKAITKLIYRVSLFSSITFVIYIEIILWKNHINTETLNGNSIIAGGTILMLLLGLLCFLLYSSLKRGILSFAKFRYVLFLRAFKDDDNIQYIYDDILQAINYIPVVKIGNPNNTEGENINEHYLPLSNWKFFLKFYISKAKAIIIVASSTDGIIWEMMQNMKYLNKCIIVFTSLDELRGFKNMLLKNGCHNTIIYSIEKVIKNYHKESGNGFVIKNDKICIGKASSLINYVLKNDFENVRVINEANSIDTNTRSKQKNPISMISFFLFRHFHILNFVNTIESIHNDSLRGIIKVIFAIIGVTFFIFQFLMGVGLMLYPLVIWFGDNADWLEGINHKNISITEKVLMSCFSIAFGLFITKELFKTFKKD